MSKYSTHNPIWDGIWSACVDWNKKLDRPHNLRIRQWNYEVRKVACLPASDQPQARMKCEMWIECNRMMKNWAKFVKWETEIRPASLPLLRNLDTDLNSKLCMPNFFKRKPILVGWHYEPELHFSVSSNFRLGLFISKVHDRNIIVCSEEKICSRIIMRLWLTALRFDIGIPCLL